MYNNIVEQLSEQLSGQVFIPLPLDADGKPIQINSMVISNSERVLNIPLYVVGVNSTQVFVTYEDEKGWIHETRVSADTCHKYNPPTVEDVLKEFASDVATLSDQDFNELVAKYAIKLRLADDRKAE